MRIDCPKAKKGAMVVGYKPKEGSKSYNLPISNYYARQPTSYIFHRLFYLKSLFISDFAGSISQVFTVLRI